MALERTPEIEFDLSEIAPRIVQASAAVATGRMRLTSPREVYALLMAHDEEATMHFRRELAHQIGATLLWMDARVIAVYQDPTMAPAALAEPLRIIVHVEFETAALRNLIAALGETLSGVEVEGVLPLARTRLEALVIDDRDMRIADQGYQVLHGNVEPLVSRELRTETAPAGPRRWR